MSQRDRQKQALTRLQRRVDWLTQKVDQGSTESSASVGGGGGGGDGGGVTANTEIAGFRPGSLSQGSLLLSHYARHEWTIESVLFVAGTPPSSDFDFEVSVSGTTVTVTLPGRQTQVQKLFDETLSAGAELRVTAQSTDPDISDMRTSFDVS